jgi:uncharacterized membrane protein YhaH (DUF805 family)
MSFADSIRTCFTKYAEFKGRASRPEYWWFVLFYLIVYIASAIIAGAVDSSWPIVVVGLAFILPLLAAAVRRLHDTGRSGWWYFIWLVPLAGPIIVIVFLATQGNPGANQYGSPPGGPMMGASVPPPPPPPA